jgi:hypothetical protein
MKTQWIVAFLALSAVITAAYAEDEVDSRLHSAVTNKIQQDHQADMKSGLVGGGARSPASVSGTSAAVTHATAAQPAQVQSLQKKKSTPPPPPKAPPTKK